MSIKFIADSSTSSEDVTPGNTYEIVGVDRDGDPYFIDDRGDRNFAMAPGGDPQAAGSYTYITE